MRLATKNLSPETIVIRSMLNELSDTNTDIAFKVHGIALELLFRVEKLERELALLKARTP